MMLTDLTIETVLTKWPQTAVLFRHYHMTDCFGCQVAPFCTVAEAIKLYQVPEKQFLDELQQLIEVEPSDGSALL